MRILKGLLAIAAVLAVVFVGGAFLMPSAYKVERSVVVNAPAAKVYPLIADPKAWVRWTVWNKREPSMKMTFSGAPEGKGAQWDWKSDEGSGRMEFTDAVPGRGIRYRLTFADMNMVSTGGLALSPEGPGTRISWTNEGDVGMNLMGRWFVPFMDRMMGPDFADGLANLKALAEKG